MDNTMLIGLTRQLTLRREMDITANNIANAQTAGFKVEQVMLTSNTDSRARHIDGPDRVAFVDEWALGRDFSQGSLNATGRPLDLALEGEGFFILRTENGERFTRDGSFTMNAAGEVTSADGSQLVDEGGNPIILDPAAGQITIDQTGVISQGGQPGQRLGIAVFENTSLLQKEGANRFTAPEDAERLADAIPFVRQGFVEGSNVRPMTEITRMMEVSRAYASVTRMIRDADELSRKAIDRLGRP